MRKQGLGFGDRFLFFFFHLSVFFVFSHRTLKAEDEVWKKVRNINGKALSQTASDGKAGICPRNRSHITFPL